MPERKIFKPNYNPNFDAEKKNMYLNVLWHSGRKYLKKK